MNHITVTAYKDFDEISKEPLNFIKNDTSEIQYPNMWCLSFTPEFFKAINHDALVRFLKILIEKREAQLKEGGFKVPLTFYLWFDEQALQLRFNILEGENVELPFGCTVNVVHSMAPVLNNFLSTVNDVLEGKDSLKCMMPKTLRILTMMSRQKIMF